MAKVKVIFVHGADNLIDNTIADFTHGPYVHVAIEMLGGIIESMGTIEENENGDKILPGVRLSPIDKYNSRNVKIVEVDLPDLPAAEAEARRLLGRPYGYFDCVQGGMYDLTGVILPGDEDITENCSELVTRLLRKGGYDILPGLPADCVTPMHLLNTLIA